MSNLDNESQTTTLSDALNFIFEQKFKGIFTAIPGQVISYNQTSKRAAVKPAIRRRLTNGETRDMPTIQNVPVCWPSGGGFALLFPVTTGDPCLIVFSQRGIENWKQTYDVENPDEGLLDFNDAMVLIGFGSLSVVPASASGTALQTESASDFVAVESGKLIATSAGEIELTAPIVTINGNLDINGATIKHNGTNIGETHFHTQPNDGAGDAEQPTDGPQ